MSWHRIGFVLRRHGIGSRVAILLLSGLPALTPASGLFAQDVPVATPAADQRFAVHIAEASQRFGIPQTWIHAVLGAESAHDIRAISSAGAIGLMQIMPKTWDELRALHWLGDDPYEPRDNIFAGAAYLREMLDQYGNIGAMLAAYNAGPARYDEYLATGRPLPAETIGYVAKLAPLLGGEPLLEGATTTARQTTDWREAPLFVVLAGGSSPAGSVYSGGQSETASTGEPARDDDADNPQSKAIFVARSGGDSQP